MNHLAHFQQVFRAELFREVEFSLGSAAGQTGTMIAGRESFPPSLDRFLAALGYAGDWWREVQAVIAEVRPLSYLFRTDWSSTSAAAVTLYCEIPRYFNIEPFAQALDGTRWLRWAGPHPQQLADILRDRPSGVGFRVDAAWQAGAALYFRVPMGLGLFQGDPLSRLADACGIPERRVPELRADLFSLYPAQGNLGVVGIDGAGPDRPAALKFDPAHVSLDHALGFLAGKGVPAGHLAALRRYARELGKDRLSYLGAKYGPAGFAGWRCYWCVHPVRKGPAGPRMELHATAEAAGPRGVFRAT
jgi:hypothetical protein